MNKKNHSQNNDIEKIQVIGGFQSTRKIWRNNTREQEVEQELKKENGLVWEQDGIIYMEGQIYIPNNRNLKEQILQENYDSVDIGHPGQQRMLELVKKNYWWPEIKEDIKKYV